MIIFQLTITKFNVTWGHYKYQACAKKTTNNQSYGSQEGFYPSKKFIIDSKLLAFSTYDLYIGATTIDNEMIDTVHTTFETRQSAPDLDITSDYQLTTDSYFQSLRFHWKKPDCRRQNGILHDYYVEMEGLDPWHKGRVDLKFNTTFSETFFVDDLESFSSYLLKVFSRNQELGGDLLTSRVSYNIEARTRANTPLPPVSIVVKIISSSSVYISWSPAYPPSGDIDKFLIQYSEADGPTKTPVEVGLSHRGACKNNDDDEHSLKRRDNSDVRFDTFCYVFDSLKSGTKYKFRLQTRNIGVTDASDWSEFLSVETPAEVVTTENIVIANHSTTDSSKIEDDDIVTPTRQPIISDDNNNDDDDDKDDEDVDVGFGSNTLLVVFGLLFGIIFLGVVVTALVYKLKIRRLKRQMRSEELWNQNRDMSSISYVGGSSVNTRISDISTYATISDASFDQSYSSYTPGIQNRRLPEPPPVRNRAEHMTEPEYCDAYELDSLPRSGYLDMSPSRRQSTHERPQIQVTDINSSEIFSSHVKYFQDEECTDTDGYLRPTFPNTDQSPVRLAHTSHQLRQNSDSDYVSEETPASEPEPIDLESYEVPETIIKPQDNPPDVVLHNSNTSPPSPTFNSLQFERLQDPRLSQTSSIDSSKRNSPSEPLIKDNKHIELTMSQPVDV